MISTTLRPKTGKTLLSMSLWTFKRQKVSAVVFFLFLTCISPLFVYFQKQNLLSPRDGGYSYEANMKILSNGVAQNMNVVLVFTLMFTLFAAVMATGYLHRKRTMDTFGALPMSRRTMFLSQYLSGFAIVVIPLTLVTLINAAIIANAEILPALFYQYGLIVAMAFTAYSATVFLGICCGTKADTVVSAIALNGAFPIFVLLVALISMTIITGATKSAELFFLMPIKVLMCILAPYAFSVVALVQGLFMPVGEEISGLAGSYTRVTGLSGVTTAEEIFPQILMIVLVGIAYVLLSVFFIKRRKTEAAQSTFAFQIPNYIIRFIVTATIGLAGGLVALTLSVDGLFSAATFTVYAVFALGAVIGVLIAHTIITLIYNRGFGGYIKSLVHAGVVVVAIGVFGSIAVTGCFGYVTAVPETNTIAKIELSSHSIRGGQQTALFDSDSSKEMIVDIHEAIVDNIEFPLNPLKQSRIVTSKDTTNERISFLNIKYVLTNGKEVYRYYDNNILSNEAVDEKLAALMKTAEYKKQTAVFLNEAKDINVVSVNKVDTYDQFIYVEGTGERREFIEALKKDIMADESFGTRKNNEEALAEVKLEYNVAGKDKNGTYNIIYENITLHNSYVNTIAFLKENYILSSTLLGDTIELNKGLSAGDLEKIMKVENSMGKIYCDMQKDVSKKIVRCMLYDDKGTPFVDISSMNTVMTVQKDKNIVSYEVPKVEGVEWAYVSFTLEENHNEETSEKAEQAAQDISKTYSSSDMFAFSQKDIGKTYLFTISGRG